MKTAYGLPKKREEIVKVLQDAFTEGNLEELEYENRLTTTYEAKTLDDLKEIIYDFPATTIYRIFPEKRNRPKLETGSYTESLEEPTTWHSRKVLMSEQSYPISHFSQKGERFSNFMGTLRIAANNAQIQTDICKMRVESWFGNTDINLLNPELAGREVHLYINGGLSEVKIKVPPGTHVSRPIQIALGEFTHKKKNSFLGFFTKEKEPENTDMAFHLVIHGSFVLGNVQVRY